MLQICALTDPQNYFVLLYVLSYHDIHPISESQILKAQFLCLAILILKQFIAIPNQNLRRLKFGQVFGGFNINQFCFLEQSRRSLA